MDTLPLCKVAVYSDLTFKKMYKGTDIFCSNCLTHENHFVGGQSWSPDLCPCGCEDTIVWYKMSTSQQREAQRIYDKNELNRRKMFNEVVKNVGEGIQNCSTK